MSVNHLVIIPAKTWILDPQSLRKPVAQVVDYDLIAKMSHTTNNSRNKESKK
jgi:hypothetical protein